jgi:hypothetical protein
MNERCRIRNGVLYLAWSNSPSRFFGDPNGNSDVLFIRSGDGGRTWTNPVMVNPPGTTDIHHVLPSLAIDKDPNDVHVSYYTQHANGTIDLDMANSLDSGSSFPTNRTVRVTSTSFNLPPTNIPIPTASNPFGATNYDRQIAVCYALGEYQSVTTANGSVFVGWGDMRNLITEPVNALDPISGQTHSQEDVFLQRKLLEELRMHLAWRWFTGLGFEQEIPHHSTFSKNRHGRFQESNPL